MAKSTDEIKLTAQQQEAYVWWMNQDKKGRSSKSVQCQFNIAFATARAWVAKFNKLLAAHSKNSLQISLNTYRDAYNKGQKQVIEITESLLNIYTDIAKISQDSTEIDTDELNKITSGVKACYQLLEQASGADLAKNAAKAKALQDSKIGQIEGNTEIIERSSSVITELEI